MLCIYFNEQKLEVGSGSGNFAIRHSAIRHSHSHPTYEKKPQTTKKDPCYWFLVGATPYTFSNPASASSSNEPNTNTVQIWFRPTTCNMPNAELLQVHTQAQEI
jgi:hypothetical protein